MMGQVSSRNAGQGGGNDEFPGVDAKPRRSELGHTVNLGEKDNVLFFM